MTCKFCNKSHTNGVPGIMIRAGHPFYASHSRLSGFGYKVEGRYESLTDNEVELAKNGNWRHLRLADYYATNGEPNLLRFNSL